MWGPPWRMPAGNLSPSMFVEMPCNRCRGVCAVVVVVVEMVCVHVCVCVCV